MLYTPSGAVVRSADRTTRADRQYEVEKEVREKLKSVDELLDVQYVEWAERYSLICKWPTTDPRWKMYQSGEIGSPYDSLGWFCEDMQDPSSLPVSLDSIENKVLELLASCDNSKHPWKDRMRQIIDKNARVRKAKQQMVLDQVEDVARTLYQAVGHLDDNKVERIVEEISGGKR